MMERCAFVLPQSSGGLSGIHLKNDIADGVELFDVGSDNGTLRQLPKARVIG